MRPVVIVAVAIALRLILAASGGQLYSGDEQVHFSPALKAATALGEGRWSDAVDELVRQEHHMGFRIPSAAVAVLARAVAPTVFWLNAFFLSFASIAVIVLVYALARRTGADRDEATVAMLFAATATTLTYFARPLMPYDTGLALDLLALWLALHAGGVARAMAVGAVAMLGFLTYYAYLAVAALAVIVHLLAAPHGRARRLIGLALGGLAVFACFELATVTWGAHLDWVLPFHVMLWRFLHGAPESWGSSYAEGWWVPWAYLWHVEHAVLVVWLGLTIVGVALGASRARTWGTLALMLYAWMALHSSVLGQSVVVGRFVRQTVPFLCLGAAAGFAAEHHRLVLARGRAWTRMAIVASAALYFAVVARNLTPVLTQRFPADVAARWRNAHQPLANVQTLIGPTGTEGSGRWVAYNVRIGGFPWPVTGVRDDPIPGCIVEALPHPLAWPGYQYEGYTEAGRAAVRAHPYMMLLVDSEAAPPCPPPASP
jgi:hypothetical protein